MSPAHVLEPTYRRLKREIMEGVRPAGSKLEALRLADDFDVSMTPVRDSLNRLVGEGLVELTPGEGFRAAALGEQELRDILEVNLALLRHGLDSKWSFAAGSNETPAPEGYASRVAGALREVAAGSGNRFLVRLVEQLNDRLHMVRRLEPAILPDAEAYLSMLEQSLQSGDRDRRHALLRYHEQSVAQVPHLIAALLD